MILEFLLRFRRSSVRVSWILEVLAGFSKRDFRGFSGILEVLAGF